MSRADKTVAKHLRVLLNAKTKAGYSHVPVSNDDLKRAGRTADALVEATRRIGNV